MFSVNIFNVSSESELDAAIAAINGSTGGGNFIIQIDQSFSVSDDLLQLGVSPVNSSVVVTAGPLTGGSVTITGLPEVANSGRLPIGFSANAAFLPIVDNSVTFTKFSDEVANTNPSIVNLALRGTYSTGDVFDFDDTVSVGSYFGANEYLATLDVANGSLAVLTKTFIGSISGASVIPEQLGLEDGAGDIGYFVNLTSGPLTNAEFVGLTSQQISTGSFLVGLDAKQFLSEVKQLDADKSVVGVEITAKSANITGNLAIDSSYVALVGGSLKISEAFVDTEDFSIVSAASLLTINAGYSASFSDVLNVHGMITGKGALIDSGGMAVIDSLDGSEAISVAAWKAYGKSTVVNVEQSLVYSGLFELANGATIEETGADDTLELSAVKHVPSRGVTGGTVAVSNNATVLIDGNVAANEVLSFAGVGTFELAEAENFHGAIAGFGATGNDLVQLDGDWALKSLTAGTSTTLLTFKNTATLATASLTFNGIYSKDDFYFAHTNTGLESETGIFAASSSPT